MRPALIVGSLLIALFGIVLVQCGSNAGLTPMEQSGQDAGDATFPSSGRDGSFDGAADGKGSTLGKACNSPSQCGDPTKEACCIYPATGTAKGVCTLRSECGPAGPTPGVKGSPNGSGSGGAKGFVGSGAQLCNGKAPCAGHATCAAETCESPQVEVCSGNDFCSGGSCSENSQCPSGKCEQGKCTSGTCSSDCPPGDACKNDGQCASGVCEKGVCVGACSSDCPAGDPCSTDKQCASGLCVGGVCAPPCTVDCSAGAPCTSGKECASGVCEKGICIGGPSCSSSCPDGDACKTNSQCESGVCKDGFCQPPACAPKCPIGNVCGANADCKSGICEAGLCVASCAPTCVQGQPCAKNGDCYSFTCGPEGICIPPFCANLPPGCPTGAMCGANTDCAPPNYCLDGKCVQNGSNCNSCGKLSNTIGSFSCVELKDSCGNMLNCSCLGAGDPCAPCPVPCQPGASNQCEIDAGGLPQMCCGLGPNAGGFCAVKISNENIDAGQNVGDAKIDVHLNIDAKSVMSACPPTCDPCGGGCDHNESCCPIIKRNKHAGSCIAEGKPCPIPQCDPLTCQDQGFNCGMHTDGCDKPLDCGSCQNPEVCGGGGPPGVCAVIPDGGIPPYDAGMDAGFCNNP